MSDNLTAEEIVRALAESDLVRAGWLPNGEPWSKCILCDGSFRTGHLPHCLVFQARWWVRNHGESP